MTARVGPYLLTALRIALGAVFLYAAWTKVFDLAVLAQDTANYQLLPAALVPFFSVAVVGVEIVAGVALVIGFWPRAAAITLTILLGMFLIALGQALVRGIDLRCGCFGGNEMADWGTVVRDGVYVAMAIPIIKWGGGRWVLKNDR